MIKIGIVLISIISCYLTAYTQTDSGMPDPWHNPNLILNNSSKKDAISNDVKEKESVYHLKPGIDIPLIAVGTGWSIYAFTKIYNKIPPTVEQVQNLNKNNIDVFDRWAIYSYSKSLDKVSYYPFYAAIPLPLIFFLTDGATRSEFVKLTFLYWEAMSVTGLFGTAATLYVDRYRPYVYSPETSMDKKTGSIAKNSFYSGHVQVVATSTFFIAKVFSDYHPDSKVKWIYYGAAALATGITGYLRLRGGEHFPTDLLLGTTTGVLAGVLVPQYHKTAFAHDGSMSILPFSTGKLNGITVKYSFHK